MVKISVIIPIFNDEDFLKECLDSVCNQTLTDIEIICINDGSTDNSLKILKDYAQNDSRIVIINQKNQGSAISRNNGLDIAKGEYIGFLDADDLYIDETGLEKMYETGISNKSDMVSANLKFLTSKRKIIPNPHYDKGTFYYFKNNCTINPDDYGIPFYFYKSIFKREVIENIRFPNLLRGQDPIFLSEILSQIKVIYGVAVDFYGYMVPTTFKKLDTYTKKNHYITQYKECIDILNNAGLFKTSDKYTNNLILYLKDNVDSEVYEIVENVFNDDMTYFKNYENEYMEFKVQNLLNNILEKNTNEYFLKVKEELSNNPNLDILEKSADIEEYKINLFSRELEIKTQEYNKVLEENENLKERYEIEKSFKDEINNSKSWKLLNKFRKLRG